MSFTMSAECSARSSTDHGVSSAAKTTLTDLLTGTKRRIR